MYEVKKNYKAETSKNNKRDEEGGKKEGTKVAFEERVSALINKQRKHVK